MLLLERPLSGPGPEIDTKGHPLWLPPFLSNQPAALLHDCRDSDAHEKERVVFLSNQAKVPKIDKLR